MTKRSKKSYYALVWNTALSNKDLVIRGELVSQNTVLPKDPRMMYGTNPNDVLNVRIEKIKKEVKYDVFTTKQSVRFIKEIEKIELPRDVRIIVWDDEEELYIANKSYRIVSPQVFEELIEMSNYTRINTWNGLPYDSEGVEASWKACAEPEERLKGNILSMLNLELQFI